MTLGNARMAVFGNRMIGLLSQLCEMKWCFLIALFFGSVQMSCGVLPLQSLKGTASQPVAAFKVGAEQLDVWLPLLKGKRFALCINQTSRVGNAHLLDTLIRLGQQPAYVFGPEHGFRGGADAGAHVQSGIDSATKIPIISLYGKHQKPTAADLAGVDVVVFDIQDVGVRFYTYISTMHYLMEACAENKKSVIILDRPNPMGAFVYGPVLKDSSLMSFVGMHRIPILHGLTVGELANMINKERWLKRGVKCDLTVIKISGSYTHQTPFIPPIPPSPNLPNAQSVRLYPSLCLFEGTPISVGRGTDMPFQVFGGPSMLYGKFQFTPLPKPEALKPLFVNQTCYGEDLRKEQPIKLGLSLFWLINAYRHCPASVKDQFFTPFFNKLAGTTELADQIKVGTEEGFIYRLWQPDLIEYKTLRKKHLLYPE